MHGAGKKVLCGVLAFAMTLLCAFTNVEAADNKQVMGDVPSVSQTDESSNLSEAEESDAPDAATETEGGTENPEAEEDTQVLSVEEPSGEVLTETEEDGVSVENLPDGDIQVQAETGTGDSGGKTKAAFFGDSLTARNNWEAMFPEFEVLNAGVGNDTTALMVERMDSVLEWQPDLVFVMGGINDLTDGTSNDKIIENLQEIVSEINDQIPSAKVYVQSVLPTEEKNVSNDQVILLNSEIENMCESQNAEYISLYYDFFNGNTLRRELFSSDGTHLTSLGYSVWQDGLERALYGTGDGGSDQDPKPAEELSGTVSNSATANEYVARTMTLTASASGGSGSYEYQFEEVYNGNREVVQTYSSTRTYQFTTKEVGSHTYYVTIKDSTGKTVTVTYTMNVVANPGLYPEGTVSSSAASPQYENRKVTLTADITRGNGGYTYRFTEVYNGQAETVQNYSEDNSYSFTTSGVGIHTYYVDVRDRLGLTQRFTYVMDVRKYPVQTTLSGTVTNSASANEYVARTMTLTAAATGGSGSYEYQFEEVYNGNREVVQTYSSTRTYQFTTKEVGSHTYYVTIKDSTGKTVTVTYTMNVVANPGLYPEGAVTSSVASPQYESRKVTLTADITRGNGGYTYRFTEVYNGQAETVQNYSEDNSYSFTTSRVGIHTYYVDVRDRLGLTQRFTYVMDVRKYPVQTTLSGTVTNSASANEYVARTMTLTAAATGGSGGYEYQFEESYNGIRKIVQAYSSVSTYQFTTKEVGSHIYYVTIRDSAGAAVTVTYSMKVVANPGLYPEGTVSSSAASPQYENRKVTLTADVTRGNGGYTYRFTEVYNGKTTLLQNYSEANNYTFTTGGVGIHTYYVDVKDCAGLTGRFTYILDVREYPALAGTITNSATANEYVDRTMTLTATASGGSGGYQYQFEEMYNGRTEVVQEYSSLKTYTFTTRTVGQHVYYVTIKDSAGATVKLSYTMKVVVHPSLILEGTLTSSRTNNEYSGTEVVLTAKADNGYGDYEYQFLCEYDGRTSVVQSYSESNEYSFITTAPGKYIYYVNIRDRSNSVLQLSYSMTVVDNGLYGKGIDVSSWQGTIDWKKVKNSGISFAMIRILSGTMSNLTVDSQFYNNISGAKENGIKVGVYRYGYATTVEEAEKEAEMVVETLKKSGYDPDYPIAYDVEDENTQGTLSRSELAAVIKAFQNVIEENGYQFMIYANYNWLQNKIPMAEFQDVDVWIARYRDYTPNLGHGYSGYGKVTIWQYSDQGSVPGISGNVDMNVGYYNY